MASPSPARLLVAAEALEAYMNLTNIEAIRARAERDLEDIARDGITIPDAAQACLDRRYLLAEVDRLREEIEVQNEIIAQLRGFAEGHQNCTGGDELTAVLDKWQKSAEAHRRFMGDYPAGSILRLQHELEGTLIEELLRDIRGCHEP